jgi:hypothetical protein
MYGGRVECPRCGSTYVRKYPEAGALIVGKAIAIGAGTALLTAFITGAMPLPEEPFEKKIDKASKVVASAVVGSLASLAIDVLSM